MDGCWEEGEQARVGLLFYDGDSTGRCNPGYHRPINAHGMGDEHEALSPAMPSLRSPHPPFCKAVCLVCASSTWYVADERLHKTRLDLIWLDLDFTLAWFDFV